MNKDLIESLGTFLISMGLMNLGWYMAGIGGWFSALSLATGLMLWRISK